MKGAKAKKYAQLVEAQSPELQELEDDDNSCNNVDDDDDRIIHQNGKNSAQDKSSSSLLMTKANRQQQQQSNSNSQNFKIDMTSQQQAIDDTLSTTTYTNTNTNTNRKQSQCSQLSTIFPSTSSEVSDSQMNSEQQSVCALNSTSSGRGTNLTRTISRSMLELDNHNSTTSKNIPEKFVVSWTNLSFSYRQNFMNNRWRRGNEKRTSCVLNDISGSFKSNQLIAIIGPSGCGKTTLLQFLAGNNSSILAADRDKLIITGLDEPKVAFIGQDDCLLPGLTARETLIYASRLQNTDPNFDHHSHIQPILNELGLTECADRSVTKLSGGQVKRVTIAQELLYPTNILILDEVTSGLDASTSYSIVKLLKQLVSDHQYPMSIVMSIHQPSARLFAVFDQVYVMSEGCCLYEGSCQLDLVNAYLSRFNLECPKYHNIADYLIEIASDDLSSNQLIKEQLIQYQRKQPQLSMTHHQRQHTSNELPHPHPHHDNRESLLDEDDESQGISMLLMTPTAANNDNSGDVKSTTATTTTIAMSDKQPKGISLYTAIKNARSRRCRPMTTHFWVHLSRSLLRIRRSYILTYLQFVTYILLGLQLATFYGPDIGTLSGCPKLPLSFMAFVFSKDDENESMSIEMRRIQENMNFLLVAIMTATFAALEITVITFPMEAKTVKREWRNGWYRVSSYFMGRSLADLPFQVLFVIAFCTVIYTLTGQIGLTSWRFVSFITIIMMTALIAQTIGFIFGALFMDNLPAAVFTAPLCIFPALLFSGFFSRVSQIPTFYMPMTYLSHFRYAFDALLVTLYGYNRCHCDQEALETYHASLENQTSTMRTIFQSLFGSSDCLSNGSPSNEENSIEDVTTISPISLTSLIINSTAATLKPKIHTLEDALVDGIFEHMKSNTTDIISSTTSGPESESALDGLAFKFSNRVTTMLNSRSNFGHEIPKQCSDFKSYMMAEFDIHDDDLLFGLMMLLIAVVMSRILCNIILSFTIASRAT